MLQMMSPNESKSFWTVLLLDSFTSTMFSERAQKDVYYDSLTVTLVILIGHFNTELRMGCQGIGQKSEKGEFFVGFC